MMWTWHESRWRVWPAKNDSERFRRRTEDHLRAAQKNKTMYQIQITAIIIDFSEMDFAFYSLLGLCERFFSVAITLMSNVLIDFSVFVWNVPQSLIY